MTVNLHCVRAHAAFVEALVDAAEQAGSVVPGPGETIEQVQHFHTEIMEQLVGAADLNTVGLEEVLHGDWEGARQESWAEEFEAGENEEDEHPATSLAATPRRHPMYDNATGVITAEYRGDGVYYFTAEIQDIDFEDAEQRGAICANFDVSGLTSRALAAWDRFVAENPEGVAELATTIASNSGAAE